MKECLKCGKPVEQKTAKEKKYCSDVCRNRYNMKKNYYKKNKDDPDYKKKARARSKQWYQDNKATHNERMRVYMKEYYRKKYSKKAREENDRLQETRQRE